MNKYLDPKLVSLKLPSNSLQGVEGIAQRTGIVCVEPHGCLGIIGESLVASRAARSKQVYIIRLENQTLRMVNWFQYHWNWGNGGMNTVGEELQKNATPWVESEWYRFLLSRDVLSWWNLSFYLIYFLKPSSHLFWHCFSPPPNTWIFLYIQLPFLF